MEKDMDNDMQISAREIEELIEGGIAFTKNRVLKFEECEHGICQDGEGERLYCPAGYYRKSAVFCVLLSDEEAAASNCI